MTMRWYGRRVSQAVEDAALRAVRDGGEHILEEANRTVPVDEGTLRRSGQVTMDKKAVQAIISYDTPYAVRVHEDMNARHAGGRRAKWLELTVKERQEAVQEFMRGRLRKALQ